MIVLTYGTFGLCCTECLHVWWSHDVCIAVYLGAESAHHSALSEDPQLCTCMHMYAIELCHCT